MRNEVKNNTLKQKILKTPMEIIFLYVKYRSFYFVLSKKFDWNSKVSFKITEIDALFYPSIDVVSLLVRQ